MTCVLEDCKRLSCGVLTCRCKPCGCEVCLERGPSPRSILRPLEALGDEELRRAIFDAALASDDLGWGEGLAIWRERLELRKPGSAKRAIGAEGEIPSLSPGVDAQTNLGPCRKCGRNPFDTCEVCAPWLS
jgi:hypothetical protein